MNLKTTIANIEFKNPVITASGTFGFGREYNRFYDISMLGGICTKGLTLLPREGNNGTRIAETASGILNCVGLQNPGVDAFIEKEADFLRDLNSVVIANVCGSTQEDYVALTKRLNECDFIDMFELNISCPNVKEGGIAFGICPNSVESITKTIKQIATKPLIVKLSPNVASIADNAKAAENGGADSISLINTITGMAINYKTRKPILGNVTGGLSGPAIKPIALRQVHEAYKAVKIPIIGMGGIMTASDVAEFLIAGASAVQVGSANIFDPNAAKSIVLGLTGVLKECKVDGVAELIGSLKP